MHYLDDGCLPSKGGRPREKCPEQSTPTFLDLEFDLSPTIDDVKTLEDSNDILQVGSRSPTLSDFILDDMFVDTTDTGAQIYSPIVTTDAIPAGNDNNHDKDHTINELRNRISQLEMEMQGLKCKVIPEARSEVEIVSFAPQRVSVL